MTKTIAQLWNGNLEPIRYLGKNNSEIKQLEKLMQYNLGRLENSLSEKEKDILGKFSDCVNEYILAISEQAFCDGYCLGTKMAVEALTVAEQIL